MMLKISRSATILLLVVAGAVYLPSLYWKAFGRRSDYRMIRYSAVLEQFVYRTTDARGESVYLDDEGNEYDKIEYQEFLPFVYWANLDKWGLFPEEINGVSFDPYRIKNEVQYTRAEPDALDAPQIPLYPLFESKPVVARLELPDDMFRIVDRIEFVDAHDNAIDEEKSEQFTAALSDAGFRFPARRVAGNPNARKAFDEGYFIADDANRLFHLKMVDGEPFVRDTGIAPESEIIGLEIKENGRREFYGYVITRDGAIALIGWDDYHLIPLPVEGYDPFTMPLYLWIDPLNRSIVYVGEDDVYCIATDTDYNVVSEWSFAMDRSRNAAARRTADLLLPFRVRTTREESSLFRLDPEVYAYYGIAGGVLGAILLLLVRWWRGVPFRQWWGDLVWTALFGVYGALATIIVGPCPANRRS